MRLSAYDLRQALLDPGYRLPPPGSTNAPSTAGSLRKAIRIYHETSDPEKARESLRQSLSNYFARPGAPTTQARHARSNLDTYIELSARDSRVAFVPHGRNDVAVWVDVVSGDFDVLVLDPGGYVARLLLFGPLPQLTTMQLEILSYAPTIALREEFDSRRVVGVDVWQLRRGEISHIPAERAARRGPDVQALLDRLR
jgi:hypothetical protein